jgi:hypothetical protein
MVRFGYRVKGDFVVFDCTGIKGSIETGEVTFCSYGSDMLTFGKNEKNIEQVKVAVDNFLKGKDVTFSID